jgi:hypothetical protein
MAVLAVLLFAYGVYAVVQRLRGLRVSEETREFSARLGRTAHAAIPLPGLTGQSSTDLLPSGPQRDGIGTEDHHRLVLDASGQPLAVRVEPPRASPYRVAPAATPEPRRKRRRAKPQPGA